MIHVGVKILKEGDRKVNRCFGTPLLVHPSVSLKQFMQVTDASTGAAAGNARAGMCRCLIGRFLCSGNVTSIGQIGSSPPLQSHQVSDWQDGCLTNTSSRNLVPLPCTTIILLELCVCIAMSCYADPTEDRLMAGFFLWSKIGTDHDLNLCDLPAFNY